MSPRNGTGRRDRRKRTSGSWFSSIERGVVSSWYQKRLPTTLVEGRVHVAKTFDCTLGRLRSTSESAYSRNTRSSETPLTSHLRLSPGCTVHVCCRPHQPRSAGVRSAVVVLEELDSAAPGVFVWLRGTSVSWIPNARMLPLAVGDST